MSLEREQVRRRERELEGSDPKLTRSFMKGKREHETCQGERQKNIERENARRNEKVSRLV